MNWVASSGRGETDLWLSIPLDLGGLSSMPRGLTEDETEW
jgi:hypothetical protein